MWLRFAKNYIDTMSMARKIYGIIESEFKKEIDPRYFREYNGIISRLRELDILINKESNNSKIREEADLLLEKARKLYKEISYVLQDVYFECEYLIEDEFDYVKYFPRVRIFFNSSEYFHVNGYYDYKLNELSLNSFYLLSGNKSNIISLIAHELVHWKQYIYDPYNYVRRSKKLHDFPLDVRTQEFYFNYADERQARITDVLSELSDYEFKIGDNLDLFLEKSPTWLEMKNHLFRENILSMKKAIYKQLTKDI